MKVTDKFVFFWGGKLSNFSPSKNPIIFHTFDPRFQNPLYKSFETVELPTSEHIFMYLKALYFKDYTVAEEILRAKEPREAKALGRKVSGFSEESWEEVRYESMFSAVYHKSCYDREFRDLILKPEWENLEFVEASPKDRIWGIGLSEDDPRAEIKKKWPGLNLLGKALCELRKYLKWQEWVNSWGLQEFHEDLIWCPSQIYYYFMVGSEMKMVYMRWRWNDPWSIDLCNVPDPNNPESSWTLDGSIDITSEVGYFTDSEYMKMEEKVLEYLKKKYSNETFGPIIRKDPLSWQGTKII